MHRSVLFDLQRKCNEDESGSGYTWLLSLRSGGLVNFKVSEIGEYALWGEILGEEGQETAISLDAIDGVQVEW